MVLIFLAAEKLSKDPGSRNSIKGWSQYYAYNPLVECTSPIVRKLFLQGSTPLATNEGDDELPVYKLTDTGMRQGQTLVAAFSRECAQLLEETVRELDMKDEEYKRM